jgi:tRNA A37 threonylcarbamoyladenosine dehydratase
MCPLAKVMRNELRKRGVKKLKVVYSEEEPIRPAADTPDGLFEEENKPAKRRSVPGSVAFVPSMAGLIIAGEIVKDLTANKTEKFEIE